ncbi:MAG: iron-containing redox enzyme family protein, partial [Pseudomonadota bacterium]
TFLSSADSSFAEGIASFYVYESQVPEIATTKIEGLKEHYDVSDERALSFFTVHKAADVQHRKDCEQIIDQLPDSETEKALASSRRAAQALWDFLSEMQEVQNAA